MSIFPSFDSPDDKNRFACMHVNEDCMLFFRSHPIEILFKLGRRWIPSFFIFTALVFAQFWLNITSDDWQPAPFILLLFEMSIAILLVHWFFVSVITFYLSMTIVTNKRILEIEKTAFLKEEMNELPFGQIKNMRLEKNGFLQNIFNYGTLVIESDIGNPLTLTYVPLCNEKLQKLSSIVEVYMADPAKHHSDEGRDDPVM